MAIILSMILFLYTRSTIMSPYITTETCLVYKEDHLFLPLSALIPLMVWSFLVNVVPWLVDLILCICLIYKVRKATAFHNRFVNVPDSLKQQLNISRAEVRVTWILVCHCLCHIACSAPEIVYLPLSFNIFGGMANLQRIFYFAFLFSPVSYMLLSIPFTMKTIRGFTSILKIKFERAIQSITSRFTIESGTQEVQT